MSPIQAEGVVCANLSDARAWVGLAMRAGFRGSDAREAMRRLRWILAECRARQFRVRWAREVPPSVEADCRRHFDPPEAKPEAPAPEEAPAPVPAAKVDATDEARRILAGLPRGWEAIQPDRTRRCVASIRDHVRKADAGAGIVPLSLLILTRAREWPQVANPEQPAPEPAA